MKFTPELSFDGGRVRPLTYDDVDALFALYQQPELPGQRVLDNKDNLVRMVDLSVQMAATQRGMMWALDVDDHIIGMVSAFDWQPSLLRTMLRVDGLPQLTLGKRRAALKVCMDFMADKYHLRNFGYQWIDGQNDAIKTMLTDLGFQQSALMRDAWRTGEQTFADVVQFNCVLDKQKPVAGRLGEHGAINPGQNLNAADNNNGDDL
ncbi:MAG: GNAT family N-acetyltransferase [Saccharospirillaceae bacterium]|nr:GNAT family N-acetyltransferase [Saccharospirillaceae bacterium]MCD8532876.1 GNAT family N-acetyltransferase [Saccharospirillaceae bacterium]